MAAEAITAKIISKNPILWLDDLNEKPGQNYVKWEDQQTSSNAELIIDIMEKYSLILVNSLSICLGLWAQFGKKH